MLSSLPLARCPDDQLRLVDDMLVLMGIGMAGLVEEQGGGGSTQFVLWLANGGDRGGQDAGKLDIIVADQRHISRNGDSTLEQTAHQTKCQQIIGAKDGGGPDT